MQALSQKSNPSTSPFEQKAMGLHLNNGKDGIFLFCGNAWPWFSLERILAHGMLEKLFPTCILYFLLGRKLCMKVGNAPLQPMSYILMNKPCFQVVST